MCDFGTKCEDQEEMMDLDMSPNSMLHKKKSSLHKG